MGIDSTGLVKADRTAAIDVPTVAQALEVPAVASFWVNADHLDMNRHMNVSHYFAGASDALSTVCSQLGMGRAYIEERGLTTFSAEHHLRYLSELRLGEQVSIHVQLLDRSAKALHAMVYLVNRSGNRIAATFEAIVVHVSMTSRRAVRFPDDIVVALDDLAQQQGVPWAAPRCGAMGLRGH